MSFLHPSILALGIAAAALPVLIHWLTRPHPALLALSTIRFVRQAIEQRRAVHRLRDYVILGLRTLSVLLIGAALARPLVSQHSRDDAADSGGNTLRVILVDVSQSMAAQSAGIAALERGRALAARQLEFRPGLRTNLILAAAQPRAVFTAPAANFAALREALAGATVLPQRLRVQPALNLAADMLSASRSSAERMELVIVGDFQRTNWSIADFSALPEDVAIELLSAVPDEPAANLAVLAVETPGKSTTGQEQRLDVAIGNYSPVAQNVRVDVMLGDEAYQLAGLCGPFSRTTLSTTLRAVASGWQTGEVRLASAGDALPADDVRYCALEVPPPPGYLLITREAEQQRPSASYYLECALAPLEQWEGDSSDRGTKSGGENRVERLAPDKLNNQSLAAADLIAIVRPGPLSDDAVNALAALVRRGRGLLYAAADPVDAVNLKLLTEALGNAAEMPVEFQPLPPGQSRHDLFLKSANSRLSPFGLFGDELPALLRPLRFSGGLVSRPLASGLADEVRATLSDDSAFLIVTTAGSGSLAVLNVDLARSNLAVSPLLVPLIEELTRELLSKRQGERAIVSGEPFAIAVSGGEVTGDLSLHGGANDDAERHGELHYEPAGLVWRGAAAGPPGVYEVRRAGNAVAAAAAVIPEEESDLRVLPPDVLEGRMAGKRGVRFHAWSPSAGERQDRGWVWLAIGCLTCVIAELSALRWFRS